MNGAPWLQYEVDNFLSLWGSVDHNVSTAVLSPGFSIMSGIQRLLKTEADHFNAAWRNTFGNQVALHSIGTTLAQGQVVSAGSALIRMTLDDDVLATTFREFR